MIFLLEKQNNLRLSKIVGYDYDYSNGIYIIMDLSPLYINRTVSLMGAHGVWFTWSPHSTVLLYILGRIMQIVSASTRMDESKR